MGLLIMIFPLCMFSLSLICAWENWQMRNLYMERIFREFILSKSIKLGWYAYSSNYDKKLI